MTKKQAVWVIIAAILLGWVFNVFVGRFLMAKVSTWPLLNKFKILSPQAPIVINNRETVRVSDSGDIAAAANDIKSKISSIALVNGPSITFSGSAINLTSDGSFVTGATSFKTKPTGVYYVVLNDGTFAKITQQATDSATSLVFFKAPLSGIPVANLAASKDVAVGDKVLFAEDSLQEFNIKTVVASVSQSQGDLEAQIYQTDFPSRSFIASPDQVLASGEAVINSNGDVVGIWNGSALVSSDVLKQAMNLYFNNPQSIVRPSFGFSYSIITKSDSQLVGLPEGAEVKALQTGSAASVSGLEINDVITSLNGQTINEAQPLEPMLEQFKPGDKLALTVLRKGQTVNLTLPAQQLK
jgi:S1-C subfamily serine protease